MNQVSSYHLLIFLCIFTFGDGKIHHLSVQSDTRPSIDITNFAFLRDAFFSAEINNFTSQLTNANAPRMVGFTFSRGNAMEEILKSSPTVCPLLFAEEIVEETFVDDIVYFYLHFANKSLDIVRRGSSVEKIEICSPLDIYRGDCLLDYASDSSTLSPKLKPKSTSKPKIDTADQVNKTSLSKLDATNSTKLNMKSMKRGTKVKRTVPKEGSKMPVETVEDDGDVSSQDINSKSIPLISYLPLTYENKEYSTRFAIRFWHAIEEGEYSFYFHNCFNFKRPYNDWDTVSFSISIVEKNAFSYLSAGEIGKPKLYFGLAVLFLATAIFWVYVLKSKRENVYKIHYLMTALVYIKALSLFFHGVNFYFISTRGRQQEAWAVVYYIMHLLKGALLFGTIILIGTGWTFFKNFLTDRDRRLFMIIIPLQVIDNIALIIILESEAGERSYRFWWQLFILVDLLCCTAIILPVIWSIRHLQEASETDGKAAFNLKKLKLFRHFYIIIIIYIYTTRILRYLISFVVPFQYEWMLVVVEEIGTWFFFVVTGYKFRPTMNNPYLRLAQSDDEEMDTALTQSGALENVVRVNVPPVKTTGRRKGKRDDDEQETGLLAEHSLEHD